MRKRKMEEKTPSQIAHEREAEFIAAHPGMWINCANVRDDDRNFVLCTFCIGGSPRFHQPGRREPIETVTLRVPWTDWEKAFHPYDPQEKIYPHWALLALQEPFPYPEVSGYFGELARRIS